ncbi:MAG: hypothetical protein K6B52_07080 [Clostridiales bacterium]|nr:hypothetical protein [Clostridiales bacterium]
MKQAKRIFTLLIAAVMIFSGAGVTVFAKTTVRSTWDYTAFRDGVHTDAASYLDSVDKLKFTPEQGASYLLDQLDKMLGESFEESMEIYALGDEDASTFLRITFYLSSVDDLCYTIRHLVGMVNDSDKTIVKAKLIGIGVTGALTSILKMVNLGVVEDLNSQGLSSSIYRKADGKRDRTGTPSSDLKVLMSLLTWLYNQQEPLTKLLCGDAEFGTILDFIIKKIDKKINGMTIKEIIANPGQLVERILYSSLIDDTTEDTGLPEGKTIDDGIQSLVNWALIDGTGSSAADGGRSMLGENHEAILPGMKGLPGEAGIYGQMFDSDGDGKADKHMDLYQLGYNAITAALNGLAREFLYNALINALDVDVTKNNGLGNESAIAPGSTGGLIIGAVVSLLEDNGAPEIKFEGDADIYPVPKINAFLDWLLEDGGLEAFIKIDVSGINITDNLMALLNDLCRLLPGFFPMMGLDVPDGICYTTAEMTETVPPVDIISNVGGEQVVLEDQVLLETFGTFSKPSSVVFKSIDTGDAKTSQYRYVTANADGTYTEGAVVNTTDPSQSDYKNPSLIKFKYVLSMQQVYAGIVKIVFNSFVDDIYFPEFCDSISGAGAYTLAANVMNYLPGLDLYERLDAYYYNHHPEALKAKFGENAVCYVSETTGKKIGYRDASGRLVVGDVAELPWVEMASNTYVDSKTGTTKTRTVEIPRAALDIGAISGAYFLNGIWDITPVNFSYYNNNDPYQTTTFEQFTYEFCLWGITNFASVMTGSKTGSAQTYSNIAGSLSNDGLSLIPGSKKGVWQDLVNTMVTTIYGSSGYNSRTAVANADFSCCWSFVDATLTQITPITWLVNTDECPIADEGVWGFAIDWFANSLSHLDLQKFLSILSANVTGDLGCDGRYSGNIIAVVISLLDRVIGMLMGGNGVFPHAGMSMPSNYKADTVARSGFVSGSTTKLQIFSIPTRVTRLTSTSDTGLLYSGNVAIILSCLIADLYYYGPAFLATIMPLLMRNDTVPRAEAQYYTNTNYGIEDLKNYSNALDNRNNTVRIPENQLTIQLSTKNALLAEQNAGATVSEELVPGTTDMHYVTFKYGYTNAIDAEAASKYFENGGTEREIYKDELNRRHSIYYLTTSRSYLEIAGTATETQDSFGDIVMNYSNFSYASYTPRSAANGGTVSYDPNGYLMFHCEDFNINKIGAYKYYGRADDAIEQVDEFVTEYEKFYQEDLGSAYGDWMAYSIRTRLLKATLLDSDNDGVADDSAPAVPNSIFPFFELASTNSFTINDGLESHTGAQPTKTFKLNNINTKNYETLAFAISLGQDPSCNVPLTKQQTEDVVKLALNSNSVDFIPDAKNTYHGTINSLQDLSAAQVQTVTQMCADLGYTFDTEKMEISRPYFRFLSTATQALQSTSSTPVKEPTSICKIYIKNGESYDDCSVVPSNSAVTGTTDTDQVKKQIRKAYQKYITAVVDYQDNILDYYDLLGWRFDLAESRRLTVVDTTALQWLVNLVKPDLTGESGRRNYRYSRDENGNVIYVYVDGRRIIDSEIMWTVNTFSDFYKAYDFATCLINTAKVNTTDLTQTMVTHAFKGLYRAWRALKPAGEKIDWANMDAVLARAYEIIKYGNNLLKTDDGLQVYFTANGEKTTDASQGVAPAYEIDPTTYAALVGEYDAAHIVRFAEVSDKVNYHGTIDQQDFIDQLIDNLNKAISNLVFNTVPTIKPTDDDGNTTVVTEIDANGNDTIYRFLFLGREAAQLSSKDFRVTGLAASVPEVIQGEKGYGTGSVLTGTLANGSPAYSYTAVIFGDINGDTRIDTTDYLYMLAASQGENLVSLKPAQKVAADVDFSTVSPGVYPDTTKLNIDKNDIDTLFNYMMLKNQYSYVDTNGDGKKDTRTDDPNYRWTQWTKTGTLPTLTPKNAK